MLYDLDIYFTISWFCLWNKI